MSTTPLFIHGSKEVAAGTTETIELWLDTDIFVIYLRELYADARSGMAYLWAVEGTVIEYNSIVFVGGKPLDVQSRTKLVLRLTNSGSEAKTISYYATGLKVVKT